MEIQREPYAMLDLMLQPAFCVKDNILCKVNRPAQALLLSEGMALAPLLLTGADAYAAFQGGCLYLQLTLSGQCWGASVTRVDGTDVFLLDTESQERELRAMALASRELNRPLSNLIALSDSLLPAALPEQDPKTAELLARMSRNLYQMQRILGNMSDAGQGELLFQPEYRNITQVFWDIFEKAGHLMEAAGMQLTYQEPNKDIYGLIDAQMMERAVLNILSNARKFSDKGGHLRVTLTQRGTSLLLSILDEGEGVDSGILGSLFSRYLRQPGLEDSRHGLGLGMVMIRNAAACHGGAVLIDQPSHSGTRVTLTMKLRKDSPATLRSPVTTLSGGRDQALIELSEILPLDIYAAEL